MKKSYLQQKDKETLSEFQQGQIDILRWLETTFQKEKSQIETKRAEEILELNVQDFLIMQSRIKTIEMYLYNIKYTIKNIKGE